MHHAINEKRETTHGGRDRITKTKKKRMPGEKETYKYVRILEVHTIKEVEVKEKN